MYIILFCIQLFFLFFSTTLSSATMHALITGDEQGSIRKSVHQDLKKVKKMINRLPQAINVKLNCRHIKAKNLSSQSILQWINKAKVGKDDIFMFYFSGHGFRSDKKSKWPAINFSKAKELLKLEKVIDAITKKHPRLSIIFCESCNNAMDNAKSKTAPIPPVVGKTFNVQKKKGLKALFMKAKGTIIACGASPNNKAWGGSTGGFFTSMFFLQLKKEIKRPFSSWKHLFSTTKNLCSHVQEPVVQLKVFPHN